MIIICFSIEIKETPGPGTYKIPSVFDKFKRLPAKQFLQLKEQGGVSPGKGGLYSNRDKLHNELQMLQANNEYWNILHYK